MGTLKSRYMLEASRGRVGTCTTAKGGNRKLVAGGMAGWRIPLAGLMGIGGARRRA